ncbi:hypothetical protein [Reichenbachiella ulvae]|uniref:GIY-YIG nuclease family protein n=1 Tax=Reichenbachiella ulvae TaxID=2980104 RepID=A0ABT3D0G5_9BACT|nr:hypothetical protein [Reichenbachiella ulvae]MCV9389311.1 hypothetical protein [Reichenbachiella ulvae]
MKIERLEMPGFFYVLKLENGVSKFGISRRWSLRYRYYNKEHKGQRFQVEHHDHWDHFWQAELIEKMMIKLLAPWAVPGKREYIIEAFPIEAIISCYQKVKQFMIEEEDFLYAQDFYKEGKARMDHYKNLYRMREKKFKELMMQS